MLPETPTFVLGEKIMKKKCYNHPEEEALSFCHSCGSYFCADCLTEGVEYLYCKDEKCQKACKMELRDKKESGIVKQLEEIYIPIFQTMMGMSSSQAKNFFWDTLEQVKEESLKEGTFNLPQNFGDILLQKEATDEKTKATLAKKRKEGVIDEDIRWWWNMHDFERRMMLKVDDMSRLALFMKLIEEDGLSEDEASKRVKRSHPIFGDPDDIAHTTGEDRPLPYELKDIINIYVEQRGQTDTEQFKKDIEESSSFNALVRKEIKRGNISDFRVAPFTSVRSKITGVSKKRSRFLSVIIGLMMIIGLIFVARMGVNLISSLSHTISQKNEKAKGPTPKERLLQSVRDKLKMMKEEKTFWWTVEYPTLIQAVSMAKNRMLSTSYRTGPGGRSQVKLSLLIDPNDALVLKIKLPKEAITSIDPKSGEKTPTEIIPLITIRDQNMDGLPDDFKVEPSGAPLYKEEFTKDGFTKFRDHPDHQSILVMWSTGIGFSVNHFLHGIDSAMAR